MQGGVVLKSFLTAFIFLPVLLVILISVEDRQELFLKWPEVELLRQNASHYCPSIFNIPLEDLPLQLRLISNPTCFLQHFHHLGQAITSLQNLSPSPTTNDLFSRLVLLIREPDIHLNSTKLIMNSPEVMTLRETLIAKCGEAEFLLESEFASSRVEDFLYYDNYKKLVQFEVHSLDNYLEGRNLSDSIKSIAVIGSGPLPLTSIVLLGHFPQAQIVNYDRCQKAIDLGKAVISKQNLTTRIQSLQRDALQLSKGDLASIDLVYLAALVGGSHVEKVQIINHLYKVSKKGGILMARSVSGLRSLLYHEVTRGMFGNFANYRHYDPVDRVVINSIAIGRKQ